MQRSLARLRVIPSERVSLPQRALLATEILGAYVQARWKMPRGDIRGVVAALRDRSPVRHAGVEPGSLDARLVAVRLANAVNRTLRLLPTDSRCLVQALTLSRLLSARDIPSTIVIGAHSQPEFAAHAWVEHLGRPIQPPEGFSEARLLEI